MPSDDHSHPEMISQLQVLEEMITDKCSVSVSHDSSGRAGRERKAFHPNLPSPALEGGLRFVYD